MGKKSVGSESKEPSRYFNQSAVSEDEHNKKTKDSNNPRNDDGSSRLDWLKFEGFFSKKFLSVK